MLYGDMNEEMLLKKRLVQHKVTINCQFVKKKKRQSLQRVINEAQQNEALPRCPSYWNGWFYAH